MAVNLFLVFCKVTLVRTRTLRGPSGTDKEPHLIARARRQIRNWDILLVVLSPAISCALDFVLEQNLCYRGYSISEDIFDEASCEASRNSLGDPTQMAGRWKSFGLRTARDERPVCIGAGLRRTSSRLGNTRNGTIARAKVEGARTQ